ncbi:MAG TPA: LytTR family DNA-binding domain-containing protein [Clostridia bacterium]|nr:MAG: Transcriptional regulatory protein YpdB [Firmicutes bacterium ADurb.Bin248]HOG01926.1 LytTR family DNA-binding domain-containing protein [Clostridia bacterium]HOS18633.1 LytTR family DNA-binding domain-containing protein [Clostridia bacterium]HPK16054.1 LytTR family DNA-binding domain-containing protein [Clostridia bacterium]
MLRIALCDDDREDLGRLERDIGAFRTALGPEAELALRCFTSGTDLICAINRGERFDIILLDVVMPLCDGIETAREIRLADKAVRIIFLSASAEFALDSYDVKAFSYLLKSGPREKLFLALREAAGEVESAPGHCALVKTKTGLVRLQYHAIAYLEVVGKTITFTMSGGEKYEMYGTLSDAEEAFLARERFLKPHRSYIVNMDCVRRLSERELTMADGSRVPVSKANYTEVKRRYIAYCFGRGAANG